MSEMIEVKGAAFATLLASHPVTRAAFREFARATGAKMPFAPTGSDTPSSPVIYVPQVAAEAYCDWLAAREGMTCRLPTMAELQALVEALGAAEADPEVWSETNWHTAALVGGLKAHYLCEWTCESEVVEQGRDRPPHVLGSIFYPPWLREGSNHTHAQAHLLATGGYSFVTFRVARPQTLPSRVHAIA